MNDKKDDSEGRYNPGDDTASLLESLFKDSKSSHIKVVRRRIRPKSVVKKRIISKQRRDDRKEISQTPLKKQRRPSPSKEGTGATKSKILSRKRPLPGSKVSKDAKTEQSRQKLRHQSTVGAKPSSKSIGVTARGLLGPVIQRKRNLPQKQSSDRMRGRLKPWISLS